MNCPSGTQAYDVCPTVEEIVPQLLALLPRGRAWGTHDGGPFPGSVAYRFWSAVAFVLAWVNARACALVAEFFCATCAETRDLWMLEYGLPDGCDPYPDLCTKVAAIGGARCEYYRAVAARSGWSITCTDLSEACGSRAGTMRAGCATAGKGLAAGALFITVSLGQSPAFVGGAPSVDPAPGYGGVAPAFAGRMQAGSALRCAPTPGVTPPFAGVLMAGRRLSCPPDLHPLECILARIAGAHMLLIYETAP